MSMCENKLFSPLPKLASKSRPVPACGKNIQSMLSSDTDLNAVENSQKSGILSATDNTLDASVPFR